MNKFNALHGDEPAEPPREWNVQPPSVHSKYYIPCFKNSNVVLAIMGRLNRHVVDNGDVDVYTTWYPLEYTSNYIPEPYNNTIKSTYDCLMYGLFYLFHS